jgi:hypothetical protein
MPSALHNSLAAIIEIRSTISPAPSWLCFAKRKTAPLASHKLAPFTYRALNRLRKKALRGDSRFWAAPLERLVSQVVHEPNSAGSVHKISKFCCRLLKFDNADYKVATNICGKKFTRCLH